MKKICCIGVFILAIAITVLFLYNRYYVSKPDLELVTEQGVGIHDFYIKDDKVYIVGGITVKNNTDTQLTYSLFATSDADYNSGLIKSAKLEGFDETVSTNIFSIADHDFQTIIVVFVGDYAGFPQKADRLMPEITIVY